MRKLGILLGVLVLLVVVAYVAYPVFADDRSWGGEHHMGGYGGGGYGGGHGGGHGGGYGGGHGGGTPYICEYGEDKTYTGVVASVNLWGGGMVIAIDEESTVTVYGLGPWWYWDSEGVALPSVGDNVTVSTKDVVINGTTRSVAMSVTNNTVKDSEGKPVTIVLRDPETCYPNWSGGMWGDHYH